MKHRTVVVVLAGILLTMGQSTFARHERNDGDRHDRREQMQRNDRQDRRAHVPRAPERWTYTGRTYRFAGRDMRGAGPGHEFHRGQRLSPYYRQRHYVVDDWRGHRLSAPPRGYHWVQAGGDYVLVAIATGIVVELLLNN